MTCDQLRQRLHHVQTRLAQLRAKLASGALAPDVARSYRTVELPQALEEVEAALRDLEEAGCTETRPVVAPPVALTPPADPYLGKIPPNADADVHGMFSPQVQWPLIGLHASLLPNGHVISYGSPLGIAEQNGLFYDDWNPALGTGPGAHDQTASMHEYNSFCNALSLLPDGRLLMVGGNSQSASMIFDPANRKESMGPVLAQPRWYATLIRLPDDRMLVLGGAVPYQIHVWANKDDNSQVGLVPEIGDGSTPWKMLAGAGQPVAFGAEDNRWWYPRAYIAPAGAVFGVSYDRMWMLDAAGDGAVTSLGKLPVPIGVSGSSAMFAPGRILFAGGGQHQNDDETVATSATTIVDINGRAPVVITATPMQHRRNWLNLTVLANGDVLANGGTIRGTDSGADNAVYQAELWSPQQERWRPAASAKRIRTYHSVSLLLPSGAVLTGAGGIPGPEDNFNAEIFYPPYLFTRGADNMVRWADRPRLDAIAGTIAYGGTVTFTMRDARHIVKASLIRAASVTHSYNGDQRLIPISFTQDQRQLSILLPTRRDLVPPGAYLLQCVDSHGVPSPSQIIILHRDGSPGSVSHFETDRATGGGETGDVTAPGVVPLQIATVVGLEPTSFWGYRLRHQNFVARIDPVNTASIALDRADSSFVVRAGLADAGCVSLESVNFPGYFLRHANFALTLQANDGTGLFAMDATFCPTPGLAGQGKSLRSFNYPDRYLRHRDFLVFLDPFDQTDPTRRDMTFYIRPGLA